MKLDLVSSVKSADRIFDILEYVADAAAPPSFSQLLADLGIPRSSLALAEARVRSGKGRSERVVHRLGLNCHPAQLGKLVDRRFSTEAAVSARLHAAKRHLRFVLHRRSIDVERAGDDAGNERECLRNVFREHRGREPVLRIIRNAHRFIDASDPDHANDRAKDSSWYSAISGVT